MRFGGKRLASLVEEVGSELNSPKVFFCVGRKILGRLRFSSFLDTRWEKTAHVASSQNRTRGEFSKCFQNFRAKGESTKGCFASCLSFVRHVARVVRHLAVSFVKLPYFESNTKGPVTHVYENRFTKGKIHFILKFSNAHMCN